MTPDFDYLRDPDAITAASFAAIRREVVLDGLPAELHDLALRIVHAAGQPELIERLAWSEGAVAAGRAALAAGADLLVDAEMVAQVVQRRRLTAGNTVRCLLNAEGIAERVKHQTVGWPRLVPARTAEGRPLTLVQLGQFTSYASARMTRDRLGSDAIIVPLKSN